MEAATERKIDSHIRSESLPWTKKLPVIEEVVNFKDDENTGYKCSECKGDCCFFTERIDCSTKGRHDFNLDGLEKYYKNFELLENNAKEMFSEYSENTIDWIRHWVGNSNWVRIFKLGNMEIIGYACPMLNTIGKCSIYPNRPAVCEDAYKKIETYQKTPCDFTLMAEVKKGVITYF